MKRGAIFKSVAILGGAQGFSQGMILAASPLLTRIYSPEDFGIFAVFGVFIGLLGGLGCLRYEHALPLARDEAEAANIFALCGAVLCVFLFVFCVVLLAIHDDLTDWLKAPALQPYVWLLPIGVFGVGIAQVGHFWAIRIKGFKRIASSGVAASVVVLGIQISLGLMRFGPAGLIFGRIGGIACSSIVLLYQPLRNARSLLRNISVGSLIEVAKKHRQFPLFFALSSGMNVLGREMPVMILSMFFGPAVTGLYALTRRVLNVPMMLIADEVRRVYYPYAAELERIEDLRHLTKSIFVSLVQIALPGIVIVGLVSPELFALVFGERWKDSGVYAQWLCPWFFMIFISTPLTRLPLVMERQGSELIFQTILLIGRGVALIVGGVAQDITLAIGLFAGVSFLCWVGFMIWSTKLIGIGVFEVMGILALECLIAFSIAAPLLLAKFVFLDPDDGLWLLAISAGCALIAAAVLIVRTGHLRLFLLGSRDP